MNYAGPNPLNQPDLATLARDALMRELLADGIDPRVVDGRIGLSPIGFTTAGSETYVA
jgi:hypothetical protein